MKKLMTLTVAILVFGTIAATPGEIERLDKRTVKAMTETEMLDRMEVLEERIHEIHQIDIELLERSERKDLKKELRYINREMTALDKGGIYISTGAIVLIIILLIIF